MPGDAPDGPALKILQVLRAPVGGLFRHVRDLTEVLAARGNRVGVAVDSIAFDALTEAGLRALGPHADLGIHRIAMPRVFGSGDLTAPGRIRNLIRRLEIDVVHGHGAKGGFYARLAVRRGNRVPVFYTPHGGVLHIPAASVQGALFLLAEKHLLRRTAGIFFESEFAREAFSSQVAPPGAIGRVVHNGVAEAEFEPTGTTGEFDFIFVGELRALKGVDVLLSALSGLFKPDGRAPRLLVAGAGPATEALRVQIVRARLSGQVTFGGAMPARQAFAQGDCVVVPSRQESLPYVVLEAAAAGKPLIASRVGGIAEIFGPTSRRLVAADDPEVLRDEMDRWLTSPEALLAEAVRRQAFVREHFSAEQMAISIESGYRSALGQR